MKIYVALLRGINVGGHNPLPMRELVGILEDLGAQRAATYIQSGNAVFTREQKDTVQLSGGIRRAIEQRCGFDPHVLVLELADFERAVAQNPFPDAEATPQELHAGFLAASPESPNLRALERLKAGSERFRLVDKVFYLHAPEGIGRSKLAASAEKLLGVAMTDRNWRTVRKILELART